MNSQMASPIPPHLYMHPWKYYLTSLCLIFCLCTNNTDLMGFFEDEMTYAFKELKTACGHVEYTHKKCQPSLWLAISFSSWGIGLCQTTAMLENLDTVPLGYVTTLFSFFRSQVISGPAPDISEMEILGMPLFSSHVWLSGYIWVF